ncbi:hypothetical protein ABZ135_04375 [Streptomyces sp. NPDC006339]|uniref:hypothetical protein n=1 Tax=Streptomyces sp. NPDC006339 TaxID=3156755 RepID=UPI0033B60601
MNEYLRRTQFHNGRRDKDRNRAESWKWDARMEELAAMKGSNPALFDQMSPTALMSLGYYEHDKKLAAEHGRDVTNGGK